MTTDNICLNNLNDLAEFKGQIIDIFEDYLDEKNVKLINPERDAEIAENNTEEDLAIIYGDHYDIIGDEIEYAVNTHNLYQTPMSDKTALDVADNIMTAFNNVLRIGKASFMVSEDDPEKLRNKIIETFIRWHVLHKE
jgi:hypothetical protein